MSELATAAVRELKRQDAHIVVWWGTEIECVSALSRRERAGELGIEEGFARLEALQQAWDEIEPGIVVRRTARRLLRVHPLRAGDALQLSAAIAAAEGDPETLALVTLDEQLSDAADREGFQVLPQQQV